jgi:hypothetical protein
VVAKATQPFQPTETSFGPPPLGSPTTTPQVPSFPSRCKS